MDGPWDGLEEWLSEKGFEDAVYVADQSYEKLKVWGFIEDKNYATKIEKSFPKGTIDWMGFLSTDELQKELVNAEGC